VNASTGPGELGLPAGIWALLFDLDGVLTKSQSGGTRSFLASRGIVLPEGIANHPPEAETVHGLGNRKNELVLHLIREQT
jgi:phosphoglycolate phosphatase-like HAD superfamily hydrolase